MNIVIARNSGDVSWTKKYSNVIIYNKGPKLNDSYNEIKLPDVGTQLYTYIKYICDNYNNLNNYTIFLHEYLYDLLAPVEEDLNKYINNPNLNINFEFLSHSNIRTIHINDANSLETFPYIIILHDLYKKIFNTTLVTNLEIKYTLPPCFIVSKTQILKRSKHFYLNIIDLMENSKDQLENFIFDILIQVIFS